MVVDGGKKVCNQRGPGGEFVVESGEHSVFVKEDVFSKTGRAKMRKQLENFVEREFAAATLDVQDAKQAQKAFVEDAESLAMAFAENWKKCFPQDADRVLRIGFDLVDSKMCSKLHCDQVTVRCLCSYYGPGTEYVPSKFVDMEAFARLSADPEPDIDRHNSLVLPSSNSSHLVGSNPFDVLLLKGLFLSFFLFFFTSCPVP